MIISSSQMEQLRPSVSQPVWMGTELGLVLLLRLAGWEKQHESEQRLGELRSE